MATVDRQQGSSTLEVVLLAPALFGAIFLIIQFAAYLHSSHVAEAAAQRGLRAAVGEFAVAADGTSAATTFLVDTGGLHEPAVTVDRGPGLVTVTVTGSAPVVMPGLDLAIRSTAAGPVERFIAEPSR